MAIKAFTEKVNIPTAYVNQAWKTVPAGKKWILISYHYRCDDIRFTMPVTNLRVTAMSGNNSTRGLILNAGDEVMVYDSTPGDYMLHLTIDEVDEALGYTAIRKQYPATGGGGFYSTSHYTVPAGKTFTLTGCFGVGGINQFGLGIGATQPINNDYFIISINSSTAMKREKGVTFNSGETIWIYRQGGSDAAIGEISICGILQDI